MLIIVRFLFYVIFLHEKHYFRISRMSFFSLELIFALIAEEVFLSWNIFVLLRKIDEVSMAPVFDEIQAEKYSTNYIQSSEEEIQISSISSKKAIPRTLKQYQDFNNLEMTGKLDTQKLNKIQPNCGFFDKRSKYSRNKRFVHSEWKWAKKNLTYSINNNHKNVYHLSPHIENQEITRAFKVWEEFIPLKFEFDNQFKPDISISFEIGKHGNCKSAFDGPYGTLAHAYGPRHPDASRKPFIHFDDEEYWHVDNEKYTLEDNTNGPNFFQIAVHEIGHVLGLDHSKDPNAIMRAHYEGQFDSNFKLSLDDVYAIQTLYPSEIKLAGLDGELFTNVPSES